MWFNLAECQPSLELATVVVVIIVVVWVGSGSDGAGGATARLITGTGHTDLPLVLPETVLAGVVAAAVVARNLPTLLSLAQGEVWVPALVILSIPVPSRSTLRPPEPWIPILHWSQANSPETDILLTVTNINTVIVIHVPIVHLDVLSVIAVIVCDLGKFSMSHLILRCLDQVISVSVIHDSVTREQMKRIPGARVEE